MSPNIFLFVFYTIHAARAAPRGWQIGVTALGFGEPQRLRATTARFTSSCLLPPPPPTSPLQMVQGRWDQSGGGAPHGQICHGLHTLLGSTLHTSDHLYHAGIYNNCRGKVTFSLQLLLELAFMSLYILSRDFFFKSACKFLDIKKLAPKFVKVDLNRTMILVQWQGVLPVLPRNFIAVKF